MSTRLSVEVESIVMLRIDLCQTEWPGS